MQSPYYWWVAGGLWGLMLDYYQYTEDPSYNDVLLQALLAKVNLGPQNNYMPPEHADEEGNDDLFFWGSAVLTAAESNFPQPKAELPSWLDMAKNVFDQLESRWDTANCGGGIFWQIRADNPNGLKYKNTIANGGFFQLAARLARATGDDKYLDWANKSWDWLWNLGMIDHNNYHIYDGAGIDEACKKTNYQSYTYTTGIMMYGAAIMADHTGQKEWSDRTEKILDGASWFFWNKDGGSKGVMYEGACETVNTCWQANADMTTFKGFLSQFMWKTAVLMPSLRSKVESYMQPTVKAAADSCSGGSTGTMCGDKWYDAKFEGRTGLGPQMCALGAIQGLLANANDKPLSGNAIKPNSNAQFAAVDPNRADPVTSTSVPPKPSTTSSAPPPPTTTSTTSAKSTKRPPPTTFETSTSTTSTTSSTTSTSTSTSSTSVHSTRTTSSSTSTSTTSTTTTSSESTLSSSTTSSDEPTGMFESSPTEEPTQDPTDAPCTAHEPSSTTDDSPSDCECQSEPTLTPSSSHNTTFYRSNATALTPLTTLTPPCASFGLPTSSQSNLTTYTVTPPKATESTVKDDSAAAGLTASVWAATLVSTIVTILGFM